MKSAEFEQIKAAIECMHSVTLHNVNAGEPFVSAKNVIYVISKFVEIQTPAPENGSPEPDPQGEQTEVTVLQSPEGREQ